MRDTRAAVTMLYNVFERWEVFLAGMSENAITEPRSPDMSIKDVVNHLWGWQQASVARLDAALHDRRPEYPGWSMSSVNPDDGDTTQTNLRIQALSDHKSWNDVYADWRTQFQSLLTQAESIPQDDLLTAGRFDWIEEGYVLLDVLIGSYEHHQEHLDELLGEAEKSGR